MNRFVRRDSSSLSRDRYNFDGDEEQLVERQALIEDQELCDDEVNLFSASPLGIRNRQSRNRFKPISSLGNNEDYELKNVNRTRDIISEPIVEFTYYDIQPGDSLQSICLRYACSVNQVKRLNGLMTDQEFYGLRKVKLPLGKLGLLQNILQEQTNGALSGMGDHSNNSHLNPIQLNNLNQQPRIINSPGSALSIRTGNDSPKFKPLLSPGFSSDRINDMKRTSNGLCGQDQSLNMVASSSNGKKVQHNHSHSFSSIRDFSIENININVGPQVQPNQAQHFTDAKHLKNQTFIKSELDQDEQQFSIDDLLTNFNQVGNVDKVFQDLDYHVEKAKAAAETYDQRAAELVNRIDINRISPDASFRRRQKVSKIPELFFCSENFGLNYKKLLVFVFIVCLIVPLVYINQSNVVTT